MKAAQEAKAAFEAEEAEKATKWKQQKKLLNKNAFT